MLYTVYSYCALLNRDTRLGKYPQLPMVAYGSRAPTSTAPGFSPRACVKAHARMAKSPLQPRDDKRSRKRGRGAPAAGCWGR